MAEPLRVRWQNYRGFADTGWLEIRPMTVLLGLNGTGKSSVIQPLLLLRQTLENADRSVPLMTTGEHVNAGSFRDFVHRHETNRAISFDICLGHTPPEKKGRIGDLPPSHVQLKYTGDESGLPLLHLVSLFDCFGRQMMSRRRASSGRYSLSLHESLPKKTKIDQELAKLILNQRPRNFLFEYDEVFRKAYKHIRDKPRKGRKRIELSKGVSTYINANMYMVTALSEFFTSMKYLGPGRDYPRRFYEFRGEYHPEIGPRGQYMYSLLYHLAKQADRVKELDHWLSEFGVAASVKCVPLESRADLLEILVRNVAHSVEVNLADSCFGLSQLLPLLVQSLVAKPHEFVITEQPEIHLNPHCETVLAEFFTHMVKGRKRHFMIETHSEHFMLRLRTHIKRGDLKSTDVAIYVTEQKDDGLAIRNIEVDDKGEFPKQDWPKGLFKEALSEAMMFATTKKRRGKGKHDA